MPISFMLLIIIMLFQMRVKQHNLLFHSHLREHPPPTPLLSLFSPHSFSYLLTASLVRVVSGLRQAWQVTYSPIYFLNKLSIFLGTYRPFITKRWDPSRGGEDSCYCLLGFYCDYYFYYCCYCYLQIHLFPIQPRRTAAHVQDFFLIYFIVQFSIIFHINKCIFQTNKRNLFISFLTLS